MGKRSADAKPEVNNVNRVSGGSPFPSYTAAWPGATVSVNHMGKRSADAEPEANADAEADAGYYGYGHFGYGYGLPGHSYAHFGYGYPYHHYGKRSAEPEPHGYYGYYGHPYGYYGYPYLHHAVAHPALKVVDGAAGVHPGGATSSVSRSPQGLRGKRSADPYYYGYYGYPGYGYHGYGASSYVGRTVWGL